ncbi:peptidyl-lysine (3S)-dioxygenase / protease, partial [Tremellales sp. Uapishka_1]
MLSENILAHVGSLLEDYRDLQPPVLDVVNQAPTALEALRMIHKSNPVLIRGFRPAKLDTEVDWDDADTYGTNQEITVAITDDGLADSVRHLDTGSTSFVKPLEEILMFSDFSARLRARTADEVVYLQSQNGNIYRTDDANDSDSSPPELRHLSRLFERDIPWMKDAVASSAEAVNLWIGDNRSTTSLHHDPYENVYHVLSGSKMFILISPLEGFHLDQQFHPASTLRRSSSGHLVPVLDTPSSQIPWVQSTLFPPTIRPLRVTVQAGETLYLPSGWWHQVSQDAGPGGIAVAVNYWYPSEINAERYACERFIRRIAREAGMEGVLPVPGDEIGDVWAEGSSGSGEEWEPSEWGR